MAIVYTKRDQGILYTVGGGAPTHSGSAGEHYIDSSSGTHYVYTTTWNNILTPTSASYSETASYFAGTVATASYAETASYALNAVSASYAPGLTYFTEAQNTSSPNASVHVNSLTAISSTSSADIAIVPKGTGALLTSIPDGTGPGRAKRGQYAIDLQLYSAYFTRVASGNYAVAIGRDNTASGTDSITIGYEGNATGNQCVTIGRGTANSQYTAIFGYSNNATSYGATSIGNNNTTSGQEAITLGTFCISSAIYASALGRGITSSGVGSTGLGLNANTYGRYGALSWAGGSSTAQVSRMIYRGNTTNDTLTSLNAQEYFDDASNTFSLQNQSAYRFKGTIIGKESGTTNISSWDIDGLIVRGASAATTTLTIANVNLVSNIPGWGTPVLSANTSLGSLKVQVQGAAATNIRWCVLIEGTEVIYA